MKKLLLVGLMVANSNYYCKTISSGSKEQLQIYREKVNAFLRDRLKLELHPDKSRIISLSRGIDFVGLRNFYHIKLIRKRNIKKMNLKIDLFDKDKITYPNMMEIYLGWQAHVSWANSFKLRKETLKKIAKIKHKKI